MDDETIFAAGADPATGPRAWARRHRKVLQRVALAAVALWFFWYPANRAELFYALPERTAAAAYVRNLATEDRALLRNPSFQYALRALGGDPEDAIDDNAGVFWTLFWLTGENSVVGVVPEEGECAGLGGYLAGASYVGWKARALELLWRIRWVPGLGPLRTTEKGTRYMEFPHARELRERDIVLGLDIVDGVLVAVLAQDPDRVAELAARIAAGEPKTWLDWPRCFTEAGDTSPHTTIPIAPWREIRKRHRFWVSPDALGPYAFDGGPFTVDLASLKRPGLEADVRCGGFDRHHVPAFPILRYSGVVELEVLREEDGDPPVPVRQVVRAVVPDPVPVRRKDVYRFPLRVGFVEIVRPFAERRVPDAVVEVFADDGTGARIAAGSAPAVFQEHQFSPVFEDGHLAAVGRDQPILPELREWFRHLRRRVVVDLPHFSSPFPKDSSVPIHVMYLCGAAVSFRPDSIIRRISCQSSAEWTHQHDPRCCK